ncbi:WD40-repeat-containing domain protein [Crepidotus variabilis]|uniref:Pre-mRNA-processing factor 19 n=1 Tax=Crepidotus variabilis TaxID=179855 RepID=A0A9P6EV79_9AGAR|nr:WD40-repeat-containing domain protein [Crepidotus variabilis]
MFYCAISGEPPQDPVVSQKSGKVYERRLIVKYINENGTDPITGDKLEEADLIAIKASPETAPPRPPTHTSIPALLHLFQNEWDAQVLATYSLQQQLHATRQELSYALYSQDAARRVIARLIRERDAAREALGNVQASMGIIPAATNGEDVEMEEGGAVEGALPANIVAQIDETHQALSSVRKKRKPAAGYATSAELKEFKPTHTIPSLHSASPAGITALALSQANPTQFLTGGNDKSIQLYDKATDKVLATLKGHTKKINHVAFREREGENTILLSAGADKIAKAWAHDAASGEYIPKATIRTHKGELSGLAVHPTSSFFVLSSTDKTYSLHDVSTFSQIFRSGPSEEAFTGLSVHPDGCLIGLGTPTSTIQIYDIRTGAIAASLAPPEGSPFTVNTLSFSENGYHLLAPNSLSTVAVWDLRKQKSTHTINLGDDFKINKVLYDTSAQFLGVAGSHGARIFAHKTWDELLRLDEGGEVSDFTFGEQGKEIWGATGREVRIWGV